MKARTLTSLVCAGWLGFAMPSAADSAKGTLTVAGKASELTHAYAYATTTFNEGKDAVVIVLSDAALPPEAVQDDGARQKLARAGTAHYVELMVSGGEQIHFEVQHQQFGRMMQPGGNDGEHALGLKKGDPKVIAGHAHTTAPEKSYDDVPYSYDVTFSATIAPAKE